MGFFSVEGKFFRALTKAGDFFLLAIFGAVFSLPIITIGASITAVYYVALKEVRDEEGYVWRGFWKSWKQNLKQSIIVELILVALGVILYIDFRVCYNWSSNEGSTVGRLLMFAVVGFMLILVALSMYIFPVLAKFDNTIVSTFKNSLVLAMHHFPQTLAMILITGGLIAFSIQFFTAFIVTVPLMYYVNAYILARIFQPYIAGPKEEAKDEDFSISMNEEEVNKEDLGKEDLNKEDLDKEDLDMEDDNEDADLEKEQAVSEEEK